MRVSLSVQVVLGVRVTLTPLTMPSREPTQLTDILTDLTCPQTDFQGGSPQVINNIANVAACVTQCDAIVTCLNAVYDRTNRVCHVKTNDRNGLTWVTNTRYDVIRLSNDVPEQENIARCGRTESTYTGNGKTYELCRGSDIRGASTQVINNVATANACAQLCSQTTGCVKAVWDEGGKVCHVKGNEEQNTLIWVMNKRFTAIRQDIVLNPASLGRWSDLIRFPVVSAILHLVCGTPLVLDNGLKFDNDTGFQIC